LLGARRTTLLRSLLVTVLVTGGHYEARAVRRIHESAKGVHKPNRLTTTGLHHTNVAPLRGTRVQGSTTCHFKIADNQLNSPLSRWSKYSAAFINVVMFFTILKLLFKRWIISIPKEFHERFRSQHDKQLYYYHRRSGRGRVTHCQWFTTGAAQTEYFVYRVSVATLAQ